MVEQDVSCLPVVTGTFLVGMVTRDALATVGLAGRADRDHAGGLRGVRLETEGPPRPPSRRHPAVRRVPGPDLAQRLPPPGGLIG